MWNMKYKTNITYSRRRNLVSECSYNKRLYWRVIFWAGGGGGGKAKITNR